MGGWSNLGMMGIFAGITAAWGQVKALIDRFTSVFVVTAVLENTTAEAVYCYLWDNFKNGRLADKRFSSLWTYVKPNKRRQAIATEMLGSSSVFYRGWRFIFVSPTVKSQDGSPGNTNTITIKYLRGSMDLNGFIVEAMDAHNDYLDNNKSRTKNKRVRYYVKKVFGSLGRQPSTDDGKQPKAIKGSSSNSEISRDVRPLKWSKDQLGSPVPPSPFAALSYPPDIMEVIEDLRFWRASRKWYFDHILPWRMGILCLGGPGTGKTSMIRAVGQELDMPVHHYDLGTMSNEEFSREWQDTLSCAPVIVLFEDFDRVFNKADNVQSNKTGISPLTLDCLLNCVGGLEQANGMLLFITANDPTRLDEAIGLPNMKGESTRPGRIDKIITFRELNDEQRKSIANRLLKEYPELINETIAAGAGETGAQFENRCGQLALHHYWKQKRLSRESEDLWQENKSQMANLLDEMAEHEEDEWYEDDDN
jgi:hypothetical protein